MMNKVKNSCPVSVRWVELAAGRFVPAIRDANQELIRPFTDYTIYRARKKISNKASLKAFNSLIESIGYTLLNYAKFLALRGTTWEEADDDLLEDFRNWCLEQIQIKETSKNERTASRTTNIEMRVIYNFYTWAEVTTALTEGKIGWPHADIVSMLPLVLENPEKFYAKPKDKYPLCLEGIGETSKSMDAQYWATNGDLDDIEDFFRRTHSPETAERNILFMRIADGTGFRVESINSLNIGQFSDDTIKESMRQGLPQHSVNPRRQKLSKGYYFDIPYPLAWEINRYINSTRRNGLNGKQLDSISKENSPIFLSMTTNNPMEDNSWSDIFTAGFQAIGAPLGSGLHSVRRKFAEDWFKKEIEKRIRTNEKLAYHEIVAALARVLGHDSKLSQEAYRRVSANLPKVATEDRLYEQCQQQTANILKLESELSQLRKMYEQLLEKHG